MKWFTGRGPVPEPPAPDDWTLDRRERLRTWEKVGHDTTIAVPLWTNYTRRQFARWRAEQGVWADDR